MKYHHPNIQLQRIIVVAGILLLGGKFTAYFLTGSNAILSDALESIVNVIAAVFTLFSLNVSARPRDVDHPYGHGKIEFISASVEGTMVLLAGIFIAGNGIYRFFFPQHLEQLNTGMLIIAGAGLCNFLLGVICERRGKKTDSLALIASGKHLQSDGWTTAGIIIALLLIYFTHILIIDNIFSIGFGIYLCVVGFRLTGKAVAGIMDQADESLLTRIISYLNDHRRIAWVDLHNMRVIKYGNVLHVDCHLTVPWYFNVVEAHTAVDAVNYEIKSSLNNPVEFFVHTDACVPPVQCRICINSVCHVREAAFEKRIEWDLQTSLRNQKHEL